MEVAWVCGRAEASRSCLSPPWPTLAAAGWLGGASRLCSASCSSLLGLKPSSSLPPELALRTSAARLLRRAATRHQAKPKAAGGAVGDGVLVREGSREQRAPSTANCPVQATFQRGHAHPARRRPPLQRRRPQCTLRCCHLRRRSLASQLQVPASEVQGCLPLAQHLPQAPHAGSMTHWQPALAHSQARSWGTQAQEVCSSCCCQAPLHQP
jgi:hypothetical protein